MKTFKNLHPYSKKKIRLEEIIRIEADINYSHLILNTGKRIMLARTLKAYENDLTLPFLRVNRSCMVNLHYLEKNPIQINNSIKMIDGYVAKISRRRVEFVSAAISSSNS
jgi:two-component system LytT family response regulator